MTATLRNVALDGIPEEVQGPRLRFVAINRGSVTHQLIITRLDGSSMGGTEPIPPGETGTYDVELDVGERFLAQCLLTRNGTTFASLGVQQKFKVR